MNSHTERLNTLSQGAQLGQEPGEAALLCPLLSAHDTYPLSCSLVNITSLWAFQSVVPKELFLFYVSFSFLCSYLFWFYWVWIPSKVLMPSEITPKLVVLDVAESTYPFSIWGLSMLWLGETVWSQTPLSQVQIHVPCSVEPAAEQTAGLLSLCKCGIYRIHAPCAGSLSHAQFCMAPWTVVQQASLSKEFSRQESLSGCHFLLQSIFSTQG